MAVFIEKPPVTSSNCYGTMKNASILMNVDWTTASVIACFPITMATWGRPKLPKNSILHCFFPSKLISKCCNFYLTIDLRRLLVCHMSKIILAMRRVAAPFKLPKQRGLIPLLATP
jgi:hypothetical protein